MIDMRKKRSLLIAAGALLIIGIVWLIIIECTSTIRVVCGQVNKFGYSLCPDDFDLRGYGNSTSIAALLEGEDLSTVCEQSASCGFPSDVNRVGRVELMLCQLDDTQIMMIYTVDGEAELVFIQDTETGLTGSIG